MQTTDDPGAPALELSGLTKRYKSTAAVTDLTFTVPRGGVIGFVGPNGAGKTTTIRMLMGLVSPTSGSARVLGHPITEPRAYLHRVGSLIETPSFYPQLSGRRNLEALAILGGHDKARVPALLAQVGLGERGNDPFKSYSLGMKQRLGIAAALLPDPDLLILDEPTNGLDPSGIREMRALLRQLGNDGKTVFVSSHLLAEIQRMCDHLVILRHGQLVFHGTVDELLRHQVGILARPADARQLPRLLALCRSSPYEAEERNGSVLFHAPPRMAPTLNQQAMAAGIVLAELRMQSADLEETVLRMTGRGSL